MNDARISSDFNEPDIIYYDLVESYISSTREILNGFMTFERGLVRILNNRIIFRNLAPVTRPTSSSSPVARHTHTPMPLPVVRPIPTPAFMQRTPVPPPQPPPQPQPQPQPLTTATFVRYRLPLPSTTTRATRGITTPNASTTSISIFSSPPHSPPPPPPTQSLSPIIPISSRINNYDWLNLIETNNMNMNVNMTNINRRDVNLTDFQEQRVQQQQQQQRVQQQPQPPRQRVEQQQQQQEQDENIRNYISYDTVQMATKLIPFCTIIDPKNEICPISQIQFEEIDCIMQIKHCKHNFNPYSLFRWLDSNSTCPMCRYNLNAYSNNPQNHSDYEMSESESESESEFD